MSKIYKILFAVAFIALGFTAGFHLNLERTPITTGNTTSGAIATSIKLPSFLNKKTELNLDLFWQVWSLVQENYYRADQIKDDQAVYGAIYGLVSSLQDPHTMFMEPVTSTEFEQDIQGVIEGIGIELVIEDGLLTINSVLKGSPAKEAGLMPKDVIYKIDDADATTMSFMEAVYKIRGTKGTQVKLIVLREKETEPLEFKVTRDQIKVDSVTLEWKGNNIAYLSINQFTEDTLVEFDRAVLEILGKPARGLILDLRFNPGGYMESSVDIAKEFVDEKVLVIQNYKGTEMNKGSARATRLKDLPMIVLINKGSASAAEILAGALQDYGRAKLVGEQTYGKGTVQEFMNLETADHKEAGLKITVGEWFTPKKRNIDKVGLTPDVKVEMTKEDYQAQKDPQLEKALELLK